MGLLPSLPALPSLPGRAGEPVDPVDPVEPLNITVVGAGASPGVADTGLMDELTSLGHTVSYVSASSTPSIEGVDVLVISASMTSGNADAWVALDVPILNLEAYSFDAVTQPAASGDPTTTWGNAVNPDGRVVADHPVVAGLAQDEDLLLWAMSTAGADPSVFAPGVDVLVTHPSGGEVIVWAADAAARLHDGIAPARRVGIGGNYSGTETLTFYSDGRQLLGDALTWLAATPSTRTGGSGGALVDSTFATFEDSSGVEGQYHLYAAGLDWSQPVGLLVYTDGSGDWGLNNLSSTYLMAGTNGMIQVAKRNNMILLTPISPGDGCTDGDGSCWYLGSYDGTTRDQKIDWARELIEHVYSQYDIDLTRIAIGGYSSGAQFTTQFFGPSHAASIMLDGVCVAISYGGEPIDTPKFPDWFKERVPFVWDVGDQDDAYTGTGIYRVQAGHAWYTNAGFETDLVLHPGLGHSRSDFGVVMEREIQAHIG